MAELTPSQQAALNTLLDFAQGKLDTTLAVLSGWAGTGKTFLVAQILTMLPDHLAIAVAAPTNKAVKVLREKLAEAGAIMDDDPVDPGTDRQDAETIAFGSVHSFLGLQLSERDDGTQECRASRDPTLHRYNLVVVDECSMIGEDLFRQLVMSKRQARILFVGDPAQLPPIQSSDAISPAFSQVQLQVRLNEIVRQAEDNPIIALSVKIRQAMEVGNRIDAITMASVLPPLPAKAALIAGDSRTIAELVLWELREGRDARVVAFTNQNVQMFNRYIHDALYGLTEFAFVPGEKVIIHQQTSGYYLDDNGNMSVGSTTLITSEEAEVVSLERKDHPLYPTVPSLWVRLRREDDSLVGVFLAISQDDVERAVTQGFAEWRRLKSMSNAAELLGQHKEAQSLLYDSKKASSQAWSLRRSFAPLRHAYALTAHKSQGSTFDSAIVDLNDLGKMKSSFQFNRALYVAATRAREHLAIVA